MTRRTIVVAFGGNALIAEGTRGTVQEQFRNARKSVGAIVGMIRHGHRVVITHGNGPQAGIHLIRSEAASAQVPGSTLNVVVADTQGSIGYMLAQCLTNALITEKLAKAVVTVLTQVVVDPEDPAMKNPNKFVGPFYKAEDVQAHMARGWTVKEDPGRGYRRVVPSPVPLDIVEKETIKNLIDADVIVIAAGGGGIPVERAADGTLTGVDAVIDKDRASALLARLIGADELLILTGVDRIAINYGKPDEKRFDRMTLAECEMYMAEGQFPKGSMGPKIEAARDFLRHGGRRVIISALESAAAAVDGKAGTLITP
ncbi:MAG TPA: carbamate kinase [Spirochaetia bacterium]|nr:carbamate kinase [Spirochaetia bacterium]